MQNNYFLPLLIFCFSSIFLQAQDSTFLLKNQFTPLERLRFENAYIQNRAALEEALNQDQNSPLVNNNFEDCWDEIESLERTIIAYKKIHLDCYYGYTVDKRKLFRLGRSIDLYRSSSEEWTGWCYGYAALVFIDIIAFLDKHGELSCLDE